MSGEPRLVAEDRGLVDRAPAAGFPLRLPRADVRRHPRTHAVNRKDLTDAAMLLADHEPGDRDAPARLNVAHVCEVCAAAMEDAPKTARWRMRARIGRRKRWYETPEEVVR